MRIEKQIGKYQENEARKNLKKMAPYIIAFAILFLTSLSYLPIYINLGILEPTRNFLSGVLLTSGLFLYFLPYYNWKSGLRGEKLCCTQPF